MDVPSCFNKMTHAFNQDIGVSLADGEDVLMSAVTHVPLSERVELAEFIDRLLDAGPEACEEAWNRSDADVFILNEGGLVRLLQEIRARL